MCVKNNSAIACVVLKTNRMTSFM